MSNARPFLALDLGAASGRAMLCAAGNGPLEVREIHRFANHPVTLGGGMYWDLLRIWDNVLEAMRKCAAGGARELAGIGIDMWNVDFGLVDSKGSLVRNPLSYRSPACPEAVEEIRSRVSEEELYSITGFGFSPITGLARLLQLRREHGDDFLRGVTLLPLPDLFRHFLSGSTDIEETVLWGTQLADVRARTVSSTLLGAFGLPRSLIPPVTSCGGPAAELLREVRQATGIERAPVFTVAGHDTVSAALAGAAVGEASGQKSGIAVLCTGSWFVLGRLLAEPRTDAASLARGVANEIAPLGNTFYAHNMMGFFFLEELVRQWQLSDPELSWPGLFREAAEAPAFSLSVDSDDPALFSSTNADRSLKDHLACTGQYPAPTRGVVVRAILEGLVLRCRRALREIEALTGSTIARIVVVGGGARNQLLCRMLADGLERPVMVGPAEATVLGNVALQMLGRGDLDGPAEIYRLLGRGFSCEVKEPAECGPWQEHA